MTNPNNRFGAKIDCCSTETITIGQVYCGFLGLNPLLSSPRNGFWSIFGQLIEFGIVAQLLKQPQNGFYKVNQDMGRKFKTARVGTPLHGIGSVKSTVLIRENPQFMWPA